MQLCTHTHKQCTQTRHTSIFLLINGICCSASTCARSSLCLSPNFLTFDPMSSGSAMPISPIVACNAMTTPRRAELWVSSCWMSDSWWPSCMLIREAATLCSAALPSVRQEWQRTSINCLRDGWRLGWLEMVCIQEIYIIIIRSCIKECIYISLHMKPCMHIKASGTIWILATIVITGWAIIIIQWFSKPLQAFGWLLLWLSVTIKPTKTIIRIAMACKIPLIIIIILENLMEFGDLSTFTKVLCFSVLLTAQWCRNHAGAAVPLYITLHDCCFFSQFLPKLNGIKSSFN